MTGFVLTKSDARRIWGVFFSIKFSIGVVLQRLVAAECFLLPMLKQALLWLGGGTGGEEPPEATVQVRVFGTYGVIFGLTCRVRHTCWPLRFGECPTGGCAGAVRTGRTTDYWRK